MHDKAAVGAWVILAVALAACGAEDDSAAPSSPGGAHAGGGAVGGGNSGGGGSGTGGAVIPEAHPRIYWNEANLARLRAALEAPTGAADRFRTMVDGTCSTRQPA